MDKEERYNYVFNLDDGDSFIYDLEENGRIDDLSKCARLLNKQNQQIADLEKELAESEKDLEIVCVEGKDTIREYAEITNRQQEEIFKLKHQLQEEKNRNKKLNHEAQKYYEDAYCNGIQNQTAIAELEKAKENMNNLYREYKPIYFDLSLIRNTIDRQIAELKGEK